ncbi:hypothetical protein [Curtobacterium flaccumfaciens]|uniref:hypothetical protein n=1 Tax=Curtobacterium flaccumfaciens TaxID=2035 RepID=UPI0039938F3E
MSWLDLGAFVPVLAGAAAVAGFVLSLLRERHPLTTAERLTAVAEQVSVPERRALIEDHRDELAVRWVLDQRAPRLQGTWYLGVALRTAAVFSFCVWLVATWFVPTAVGTWVSYGAAIVLFLAGTLTFHVRQLRRLAWMDQERRWRSIPQYETAARVTRQAP